MSLGCGGLSDADARAVRVAYARASPFFGWEAFEMLLYDGRKKKKKREDEEADDPMLRKQERRKSKSKTKKKPKAHNDGDDAAPAAPEPAGAMSSLANAPKL